MTQCGYVILLLVHAASVMLLLQRRNADSRVLAMMRGHWRCNLDVPAHDSK